MTTKEHYENHLAHFYEWMVGDFETKQSEQLNFFNRNGIKPLQNKVAIDLGSGHGLQSIALAKLGFKVKSVDFNEQLLDNLSIRGKESAIQVFQRDLLAEENFKEQVELIVCMGDTIAHMESVSDIHLLLDRSLKCLVKNGKLILSYRDYGTELVDIHRFIPVKADDNKILTCILEYSADNVKVTDLLHERIDGEWLRRVSSYFKLRITNQMIEQLLNKVGFKTLKREVINRMYYLVAEK